MNSQLWKKILIAPLATIGGLFVGGATVLAFGVFESGPVVSQAMAFSWPTVSEPASLVLFGSTLWAVASVRRRNPQNGIR